MIFGGIHPCSTIDYPRLLSCVLFTRGCNLNCFYCHNRNLISKDGPVTEKEGVMRFLSERQNLLDAVVLSGGEPTLQPDLKEMLTELRRMGFKTKLDTNGMDPDKAVSLVDEGLLDYVAVDLKAPKEDYSWVCGDKDGFGKAQNTILELLKRNIDFEARCTVYPGLTPDALFELLASVPPLPLFRLNAFKMPEVYDASHAFLLRRSAITKEGLEVLLPRLKKAQPNVRC